MTPASELKDGECSWSTNVSLQDPPAGSKQKITHDRRSAPRMESAKRKSSTTQNWSQSSKDWGEPVPSQIRQENSSHPLQTFCLALFFGDVGTSSTLPQPPSTWKRRDNRDLFWCFSVSVHRSSCLFIFVPTYHSTTLNSSLVSCTFRSFWASVLLPFFFSRLKMSYSLLGHTLSFGLMK